MARKTTPKYCQISDELRQSIRTGLYGSGDRLPTEAELAGRYNASRTTVIRALRDLEDEGLLTRRQGSGSFATPKASSSPHERRLFGLIVPGVTHDQQLFSIFPAITEELSVLCHDVGAGLLMGSRMDSASNSSPTRMVAVAEQMLTHRVDGVFLVPQHMTDIGRDVNHQVTQTLSDRGVAMVLLDRDIVDFPQRSRFDLVSVDNHRGGYLLGHHLISQGRRRLAFVSGEDCTSSISARAQGAELAMREAGLAVEQDWRSAGTYDSQSFVDNLLRTRSPDGIICANDAIAAIVMRHLAALNVSVPDDVAVVGFDNTPVAPMLPTPLTTIRQPTQSLAKTALRLMLDRIESPDAPERHVLTGCELIVRKSSEIASVDTPMIATEIESDAAITV